VRHPPAFAVAMMLLAGGHGVARAGSTGLFGSQEVFTSDLAPLTKWDAVMARIDAERDMTRPPCAADSSCVAGWWQSFIAKLKSLPLEARVLRVNRVMNHVRYVPSEANWRDPDHWETPLQFLTHGGQCQDYAIAKFMALADSGVPDAALRFVVVRDALSSIFHAVTVAFVEGEPFVLDNETPDVLPSRSVTRYVPYYSINRSGWWYHESTTSGLAGAIAAATR